MHAAPPSDTPNPCHSHGLVQANNPWTTHLYPPPTASNTRHWAVHLHDFHDTYQHWMNEKTTTQDPLTGAYSCMFTHLKVRSAFHSLQSLSKRDLLVRYLKPPPHALDPKAMAATTNPQSQAVSTPR